MNDSEEFAWIKHHNDPTIASLTQIYDFLDYWKRPIVMEEFLYWLKPDSEEIVCVFIEELVYSINNTEQATKPLIDTQINRPVVIPCEIFAFLQESRTELYRTQQYLASLSFQMAQIQRWSRKQGNENND